MDYSKSSIKNLVALSLFLPTIILLGSWKPITYKTLQFSENPNSIPEQKDDLEVALKKASMTSKTVIITIINKAYVEPCENECTSMLDLFLEGFWVGEKTRPLVGHLLVVSMDKTAHERCEFRRLNCYNLGAQDGGDRFSREQVFMSDEFIEMMWRRTHFLVDVLKRGYSFIFTDADILWLRNPSTRLMMKNEAIDLQLGVDSYNDTESNRKLLINKQYLISKINTGFYFIRSNNKTTTLFQKWYDLRKSSAGMKEQDVFVRLINSDFPQELKLNVGFLNTIYFSGFCTNSRDIKSVVTVHANCCRTIKAKVADLKVALRDWRRFKDEENNGYSTSNFRWSKHVFCRQSWGIFS